MTKAFDIMNYFRKSSIKKCFVRISAFTLAEVLITLGIIGVVAALTIPTLVSKTKKNQETVALKKFYSAMSQAIKLSEADNGDINEWYYDNTQEGAAKTFYDTYLDKYIQSVKKEYNAGWYKIYFNDGSTAIFAPGTCLDIRYDVNGPKNPNNNARDIFRFLVCTKDNQLGKQGVFFDTYYIPGYTTRDSLVEGCKTSVEGVLCAKLLQWDNWEFKDDYPWKI